MKDFTEARDCFTEAEDIERINEIESQYEKALPFAEILESRSGTALVEWLNSEITNRLLNLFESRDVQAIADLKAAVDLKTKISNSRDAKTSIESWLANL
ncbi:MAG TPA: hypothetical protein PKW49_10670 [Paludibacteraceae bacterium]|nr:hypothetical protein [Paludibacteraceae bacterium]